MIAKVRSWTRSFYSQTQAWGRSKNCIRDLVILTIISSTIVPVPVEALLIAIVIASPQRWWRAAVAATVGSTIGALVWYLAGKLLFSKVFLLLNFLSPNSDIEQIKMVVQREGVVYLSVAAFTPGLFRVGMVAAGVVGFNPILFILSMVFGRGTRFIIEAGLLRYFGKRLSPYLEKYFDVITVTIGFIAILFLVILTLVNK